MTDMKKLLTLLFLSVTLALQAQMTVGVQIFDMYKVENVTLMTPDEFRDFKEEIAEERRVFNKALSTVKRAWDKQVMEARKAGDKDFPKYPTKTFIFPRNFKYKNFTKREAAEDWLAKQQKRVDAFMSAEAARIQEAAKAAKGSMTVGYADRDAKKERRKQEKKEMELAVMEKLGEEVELQMATMLKYNRPVPKHFIMDPIAGAEKTLAKKIEQQEAAIAAYKERKAAAEAALGETEE